MPAVHKNFFLILLSLRTSMTSEQPIQFRYRYRPIYWYSRYEKTLSVSVIGIAYRHRLNSHFQQKTCKIFQNFFEKFSKKVKIFTFYELF